MSTESREHDVKVIKLIIKGLYGQYDYDVKFDENLTFLSGANGSGKTTILDILSSVITGELYRLSNYAFKTLELFYVDENRTEKSIHITPQENGDILLLFNGKEQTLTFTEHERDVRIRAHVIEVFNVYPVLKDIRGLFPFIYLPLNRKSGRGIPSSRRRLDKRERYHYNDYNERNTYETDDALDEAQELITKAWRGVSQKKQSLDRDFRDNLFKSLITTQEKDIFTELKTIDVERFNSVLNDYTQVIKGMSLLDEDEYKKFTESNDNLVATLLNSISKGRDKINASLAVNFYRVWQANEIAELAKELQKNIEDEEASLTAFLETMNSFFGDGEDAITKKTLLWSEGKLVFRSINGDIDIDLSNLSSGEKQLFIFFSHLVFSLQSNTPGILVVDEPELSLHLAWQREYVSKILSLNQNVQLIFATHAPEIIMKHRNNVVKLNPTITEITR